MTTSIETELKLALYDKLSGLVSLAGIPIYYDHAPQTNSGGTSIEYPLIVYKILNSKRFWSMGSPIHKYSEVIIIFKIYGNEDQFTEIEDISNNLESGLDNVLLTLNNSVSNFGTYKLDSSDSFYNENEKIWLITSQYKFFIGI